MLRLIERPHRRVNTNFDWVDPRLRRIATDCLVMVTSVGVCETCLMNIVPQDHHEVEMCVFRQNISSIRGVSFECTSPMSGERSKRSGRLFCAVKGWKINGGKALGALRASPTSLQTDFARPFHSSRTLDLLQTHFVWAIFC